MHFIHGLQVFSDMNGLCQLQLDRSARRIVNPLLQREEKKRYLSVLDDKSFFINNMIKCEIEETHLVPISTSILSSIHHRKEEIRKDNWEGLTFL